MTKQDILDYFSLIDFAYNESGRLESLSRMLDELLKEQEAVEPKHNPLSPTDWFCGKCGMCISRFHDYCPSCGQAVKWE